ncbi:Uncharacterised protein [Mycobacteroides abscessus subsp. abscessus]|nr:Uncharacterised protein [Mycobacteroides abscessus subsp. abscessus]
METFRSHRSHLSQAANTPKRQQPCLSIAFANGRFVRHWLVEVKQPERYLSTIGCLTSSH